MAKPDLQNFTLPGRIISGVIAILLIWWLLRITGTI
jgi:Na+/glutamate symporter